MYMNTEIKNLKFFLYARKSSESDERQVHSITSQLEVMKRQARKLWFKIVWIYTESKSAKKPWRPKFNEMLKEIKKGKANWIISWKLDRLTRNPIDTGAIQYMLQTWELRSIYNIDIEYTYENSGLMFSVSSGMANQFLLDLSKNVKRWLDIKVSNWWLPWVAPEWYKNNLEFNTIDKHPVNFNLVKKMWKLMLTWNYSVLQIVDIANNKWWFRTTKRKKSWWKKLSYSSWYRILNNIFYAWYFEYNWKTYKWKHKAMITLEEYHKVKALISDKGKAKVIKHEFPYWWIFDCWCCGFRITAENKIKRYKSWRSKYTPIIGVQKRIEMLNVIILQFKNLNLKNKY